MPDLQWFTFADHLVAWLLTYALHSTLLLAGAWLLSSKLSLAARETVWKSAVVGSLFTATLQLIAGPAVGALSHRIVPPSTEVMLGSQPSSPIAAATLMLQDSADTGAGVSSQPARRQGLAAATAQPTWRQGVALLWAFLATITLLVLASAYRSLRIRLANRKAIVEGPTHKLLESLRERSGMGRAPRLCRSEALNIPIARGVLRPEICLPQRALGLSEEHQESLLAHELAHVQRRDPAWLVLNRILESTLFFQPLNIVARRQLQEIAEFRCDALAARWTGRPESLARCLTEVAAWSLQGRRVPARALAPSLAERNTSLRQRVCRLLDASFGMGDRTAWWMQPTLGVVLLAFALTAPGFSPADGAPVRPEAPEAYQTPESPPERIDSEAPESPPEPAAAPRPASWPQPAQPSTPPVAPKASASGRTISGQAIPAQNIKVPEVRIPEVRVPEFQVQEIQIPEIRVPEINLPDQNIHIPEIHIPAINIPAMLIPEIKIPEIFMPEMNIEIPEIEIPEIDLEELGRLDTIDLEASLAKLDNLGTIFEESHTQMMEQLEEAFEQRVAPALEQVDETLGEGIEPHLEQLEREIRDAQREGNPEREEALRNVQQEMRLALMRQHEQLQPYRETVHQATALYHQELAERHQQLDQERSVLAREELAGAREAVLQELAHRHAQQQRGQIEEIRAEEARARAHLREKAQAQKEVLRAQAEAQRAEAEKHHEAARKLREQARETKRTRTTDEP